MKRAFYDLSVSPYSYDFAQFIIAARASECDEVVIVPGRRMVPDGRGGMVEFQKCTPAEQEFRMNALLMGLAPNAIQCQTREEAATLWHAGCFPEGYTIEEPRAAHLFADVIKGGKVFPFLPTDELKAEVARDYAGHEKLAVITIRDTHIKPERNSSTRAWVEAADWMRERGFTPVFVPDTEHPEDRFGDHLVAKRAAFDVQYRIALYDAAYLNLGVNNGPMVLNLLSRRPVLYFRPICEAYKESSAEGWQKNGLPKDTQPPWFAPTQRIIWDGGDDAATIRDAVERWERAKAGDQSAWPLALAPAFPIKGVLGAEVRGAQMTAALEAARVNGWEQMKRKPLGTGLLSVVCYGPSLKDTWREIKRPMLTVSGAHDFLVERGVVPDFHMDCDPREHKAELVKRLHADCEYLMATVCHPSFWPRLAGHKVRLWHLHNGPETDDWLAQHDKGANRIGGGTTAGSRALEIGSMLGYRRFEIHGMDCSYRGEARHAGAHGGKQQNALKVWCAGREFLSSAQMIEAAREMLVFISNYDAELWFHGEGLQQTMVEAFKSRFGVFNPSKRQKAA